LRLALHLFEKSNSDVIYDWNKNAIH
jgi:hypothetical protein